ncbi:MAG: type II secretion system protein GspM [Pseudomonadales bacterium]|nr:type II secretion system protein GspM [Pseudomonadales bacterium]NRA17401.1 type II secretion system protein M [Oceanospirillaceae bacterium]
MNSTEIAAHYQALSNREKILIFTSCSALIIAMMFLLLLEPQYLARQHAATDFLSNSATVQQNQQQTTELQQILAMDPTASMREQLTQLQSQHDELSQALNGHKTVVVTPVALTEFLAVILKSAYLLKVENFQLTSELYASEDEDEDVQSSFLMKQSITLQLQGNTNNIEKYLQFLEEAPVTIYWDNLRYQSEADEQVNIAVQLHLFSSRELLDH